MPIFMDSGGEVYDVLVSLPRRGWSKQLVFFGDLWFGGVYDCPFQGTGVWECVVHPERA